MAKEFYISRMDSKVADTIAAVQLALDKRLVKSVRTQRKVICVPGCRDEIIAGNISIKSLKHEYRYEDCSSSPSSINSRSLSIEGTYRIVDIRQEDAPLTNLRTQTLEGLRQPRNQKYLPSLLLWGDEGQQLYDEIVRSKHYYPYRVESELLKLKVGDIARKIASTGSDVLLELGAGNMEKTGLILRHLDALDTPLTYYALDVDHTALEYALKSLQDSLKLRNINLCALQGTYEDAAKWLATSEEARGRKKTIAWLGNSIANLEQGEAGDLLGRFSEAQGVECLQGFIIGIDGCQDVSRINKAYDIPGGATRRWVRYALKAGRLQLGPEADAVLHDDNWQWAAAWNPGNHRYENYLTARKTLTATIDGTMVKIEEGERLHTLSSGKWTRSDVDRMCSPQGLVLADIWSSPDVGYGIYWLQPAE
ncbi:hypothetical protein EJ05DRAFT_332792 [Pseudovirgaria hyperparasitica]|uniref:Histidine-specific methyltransferase SAM-dependent domain-containing protein n=1 Tax=Pseudovirgaria hyperparasitica TaxID=470096 RepID=A0A6A6WBW6_9PEZI|nr:uncharacterized protein EJ05DRAFT_332792 [Pseudovirgaria hyperparasitica]KAF2759097.1 hypothetical protein EJ05DRAFT_332792 [Pseudovirgaria hyperparasitica]